MHLPRLFLNDNFAEKGVEAVEELSLLMWLSRRNNRRDGLGRRSLLQKCSMITHI